MLRRIAAYAQEDQVCCGFQGAFWKGHEVTAAVKNRECEGHRLAGCVLLAGRAEARCGLGVRHPKSSSHAEVDMPWDRKCWTTALLRL